MFSVSSVSEIKKDIENMGFLKVTVIFFLSVTRKEGING